MCPKGRNWAPGKQPKPLDGAQGLVPVPHSAASSRKRYPFRDEGALDDGGVGVVVGIGVVFLIIFVEIPLMSKEAYMPPVTEWCRFEPGWSILEVSPTGSSGENAGDEPRPVF